ncbi:hypothetical protein PVAND_011214 [Polypedilum vanderplanki]|uniref:Carboxylic ester hydrolase n=1 Tax=Polypedilum vanderplanki TaxID=319348 RepID=A0A9J6CJQ3_POLVA|nr:hypothetical protein PVAND_011214 [Polypedilum vanderplanki]
MKFEIVQSEYGPIKGVHKESALGTNYVSFQSIPYMKAPIGKLRFRDAEPMDKWSTPFDASFEATTYYALNFVNGECEGKEDSGVLNIFTKSVKPKKLYPVMIWIHGGGFIHGSSTTEIYGPDYFLQKDVVFVSINYRLGAIGFLSLNDKTLGVPGNGGLKDQLFAIKWIKRNIHNFGGDSNNITLFGESAGAASCHYLSISEQSKGLFQRIILMSGTSLCKTWAFMPRFLCQKFSDKLARKLGWKGKIGDERDLLEYLENASAVDIVVATKSLLNADESFGLGMISPFVPVVEPYESENCLISKDPVELVKTAWSNEIDILFTGNSFEGVIRSDNNDERAIAHLNKYPAFFLPLLELNLSRDDPKAQELGQKIKSLYFSKHQEMTKDSRESYLRFSSELLFWNGIYRAIQSRVKYARANTFLMRFDAVGEFNMVKDLKNCSEYQGAAHGDDLFYLFKNIVFDIPEKSSKESNVIEKMIGMFTSFAINGNPNCEEISPVKFRNVDDENVMKCVEISENGVSELLLPDLEKLKVWASLYHENENFFNSKL